jgi:hypothetical protein
MKKMFVDAVANEVESFTRLGEFVMPNGIDFAVLTISRLSGMGSI